MITALLHSRDVHIAPGASAEVELDLVNGGREPVLPRISVSGAPPGVVAVPLLTTPLAPGETRRAVIGITIPRTFSSGRHQLSLRIVTDGADPDTSHVPFSLSVLALDNVALSVNPASVRGRWRGRFKVVLHNRSDVATELALRAEGDDVSVRFKPSKVRVRPGERTTTRATVRSRPVLFATASRKPFTIFAQARSRPLQTSAVFSQRPVFGLMLRRGALIAGMLALAIATVLVTLDFLRGDDTGSVASDALSETGGGSDPTDGADSNGDSTQGGDGSDADGAGIGATTATAAGVVALADESEPAGVEVQLRPISLDDPLSPNVQVVGPSVDRSQAKNLALITQRVRAQQGTVTPITLTTSENGTWKHSSLVPGGHYEVLFSKAGYTSQAFVVSPSEAGEQIELEVSLEPGTGAIGGTVTNGSTALGGAKVTITDGTVIYTATTSTEPGSIGTWEIEGIGTPARYVVTVELAGFGTEVRSVELGPGESSRNVRTVLTSGVGSIVGTVSSGGIGQGGITITITGGDFELTTTSLSDTPVGSFSLPNVPLGVTYTLEATGAGWLTQTQDVFVDGAETVFVEMISATGRLQGVVTTDTPADPASPGLGDVRITVTGNDLEFATTSADTGEYAFSAVPPGEYVVSFDRFEHNPTATPITIGAGATTTQDVTMAFAPHTVPFADARLFGRVTNQRNDDVGGATITVLGHPPTATDPGEDGNGNVQVIAEPDGTYDIEGLDFGAYTVRIEAASHQLSDDQVSFGLNAAVEHNRQIFTLGSFEGFVRPSWDIDTTLGINAADVFILEGDGTGGGAVFPATTRFEPGKGDGYYALSDTLTGGLWTVQASAQGFVTEETAATSGVLGETTLVPDLHLNLRPVLEVLVVEPQNDGSFAAIAGATVTLTDVPTGYTGDTTAVTDGAGLAVFQEPTTGAVTADTPKPVPGSYTFGVTATGYDPMPTVGAVLAATPDAQDTPATVRKQVALVQSSPPGGTGYLVGGTITYSRDDVDLPINGTRVQATVISGFTPTDDPTEPTPILLPIDVTFPTNAWSVPEHRHGNASYDFSQTDFTPLNQDINASADVGGGPSNDLIIRLDPLASSISGTLVHTTGATVDVEQFQITADAPLTTGSVPVVADVGPGGTFTLPGLHPGTWDLDVQHDSGGDARFIFPGTTTIDLEPNEARVLATAFTVVERADLTVDVTASTQASISIYNGVTLIAGPVSPGGNSHTFTNLAPNIAYDVDVTAPQHVSQLVTAPLLVAGVDATVPIDLAEWATVSGKVQGRIGIATPVDRDLGGVTVTLTDTSGLLVPGSYQTTTDATTGDYSIQVPPGTWAVTFSHTDYSSTPVTPVPDQTVVTDTAYPLGTSILPVLPVDVVFQILSDETDIGGDNIILDGATITLTHATETGGALNQGATGTVTFTNLQPVDWTVTVTATNHTQTSYTLSVPAGGLGATEVITLNRNTATVHFIVSAGVTVGGPVVIGPVSGAEIEFPQNSGDIYTTVADGTADVTNVENRTYNNIDVDAEPAEDPNLLYAFQVVGGVTVSNQPGTVNVPVTLAATDGQIDLTVSQTDANAAADFTNLSAQLYFVDAGTTTATAFGSAVTVGADKTHSFTVPPSKPTAVASVDRLYYWEVRLSGTGFETTTSSPIDVNPNATTAAGVAVLTTPTAPTGLMLTPSVGQFVASWTAVPGNADGGAVVSDYRVYWGPTGSTPPLANSLLTGGPTTLTVTTNLSAGDVLDVQVTAINSVGESLATAVSTVTIPSGPAVISDLAAAVGTNAGEADLTWTAPAANGSAIDEYELSYKLAADDWGTPADVTTVGSIATPGTVGTPQTVTGLTSNSAYVFRIRSHNGVGWSSYSTDVGFTAVGAPGAPTITDVDGSTSQELTITWTAGATGGSAFTDYEVTVTDGVTPVVNNTGDGSLTLTVTGLTDGVDYTVTVRAKNSDFWSAASASSPGKPLGTPGNPTTLRLTAKAGGFDATWVAPSDDGGDGDDLTHYEYRVLDRDNSNAVVVDWTSTGGVGLTLSITGLEADNRYRVEMRAHNAEHVSTADTENGSTPA